MRLGNIFPEDNRLGGPVSEDQSTTVIFSDVVPSCCGPKDSRTMAQPNHVVMLGS